MTTCECGAKLEWDRVVGRLVDDDRALEQVYWLKGVEVHRCRQPRSMAVLMGLRG